MKCRDIGYLIKQINDKLKAISDNDLKSSELTLSQSVVLEYLYTKKDKITQKEIEAFLGVSHPTTVGIINRLEKKGFIACFKDEKDKRNKIVCLTEKADKIAEKMFISRNNVEKLLVQTLSEKDIEQLKRLLELLYKNLS